MATEQVKNLKFNDRVVKEDANGSVGNVKTGNLNVNGNLAVSGDLTVRGNLTVEGDMYLYDGSQRYHVVINTEYNTLTVAAV